MPPMAIRVAETLPPVTSRYLSQLRVRRPLIPRLLRPEAVRTLIRRRLIRIATNVRRDLRVLTQRPRLHRCSRVHRHRRRIQDFRRLAFLHPLCETLVSFQHPTHVRTDEVDGPTRASNAFPGIGPGPPKQCSTPGASK